MDCVPNAYGFSVPKPIAINFAWLPLKQTIRSYSLSRRWGRLPGSITAWIYSTPPDAGHSRRLRWLTPSQLQDDFAKILNFPTCSIASPIWCSEYPVYISWQAPTSLAAVNTCGTTSPSCSISSQMSIYSLDSFQGLQITEQSTRQYLLLIVGESCPLSVSCRQTRLNPVFPPGSEQQF